MWEINMPNCVPQSPTWLTRFTSWPQYSRTLQIVSPMMVERKWPTCISLAMFGEEKSTRTVRRPPKAWMGGGGALPSWATVLQYSLMMPVSIVALTKPAGATTAETSTTLGGRLSAIAAPTARGLVSVVCPCPFKALKMPMGALHW